MVDRGAGVGDTGKACALGASLVHPLGSISRREPYLALAIAEGTSALCAESVAWEADLDSARARRNFGALGDARAAEITDARLAAERAHAQAAARFERSFAALQAEWGPVGEGCPRIREKDEFVYLFGLVAGTLALLHDRASGGVHGIPLDRLAAVARGSECLDDARWWSTPRALRGAAWATVPGSGPEGTDPWTLLDEAAASGETSGVRVARAMQVLIASNSGRTEVTQAALAAHAASLETTPPSADWALLDEYARLISLQQSDLAWTEQSGHRTERFGRWPGETAPVPGGPVPFGGADPFGGVDPFGAPAPTPAPADAPEEETK